MGKIQSHFVDESHLRQNKIYDVSNGIFFILRDLSVQLFSKLDSNNDSKCVSTIRKQWRARKEKRVKISMKVNGA